MELGGEPAGAETRSQVTSGGKDHQRPRLLHVSRGDTDQVSLLVTMSHLFCGWSVWRRRSCSPAERCSEREADPSPSSSSNWSGSPHSCWETPRCICSGDRMNITSANRTSGRGGAGVWAGAAVCAESNLFPMTSLSLCRAPSAASWESNCTKASPEFLPLWSVTTVIPFSAISKPANQKQILRYFKYRKNYWNTLSDILWNVGQRKDPLCLEQIWVNRQNLE